MRENEAILGVEVNGVAREPVLISWCIPAM